LLTAICTSSSLLGAQTPAADSVLVLNHVTAFSPLPSGIAIEDGISREEITALRDNIIRVRIGAHGTMPEDASWAVLRESRESRGAVTPEVSAASVGFRTSALTVQVSKSDMRLTILDPSGKVIQQDALPVRFQGSSFRVSRAMPLDEHYFGLGDKTGPLDRREQAFSLWNTDAYRFQESTDPIYKSIPFFMTYRAGIAAGVLLDDTWRSSFDFGRELPGIYSFGAVNGPLDYYVMYGPSPKEVVESYAWLTGKPPLPPLWTFGFQQSRYTYTPQSRVLEVADRLRSDHISRRRYLPRHRISGEEPPLHCRHAALS
jgi:alpha-glucosidase